MASSNSNASQPGFQSTLQARLTGYPESILNGKIVVVENYIENTGQWSVKLEDPVIGTMSLQVSAENLTVVDGITQDNYSQRRTTAQTKRGYKKWTKEEEELALSLCANDNNTEEIGKKLKRSKGSVQQKLYQLKGKRTSAKTNGADSKVNQGSSNAKRRRSRDESLNGGRAKKRRLTEDNIKYEGWIGDWQCEKCTFINNFLLKECEMCDTAKEIKEYKDNLSVDTPGNSREYESKSTNDEVKEWLKDKVGLPQYFDVFIEHKFDMETIKNTLTKEDLKEMGIQSIGHRNKILFAVNRLQNKRL